ncbi:MAG: ABC transporter permease [Bacteroidales bacterium]|nr:ABC transporter permease [Bacteroidales bacterium]
MNLRIAWRNIWRNKKRSLITISSVVLAVVLATFTRSFQEGTYELMIENAIGKFSGYVQVHQKDYWEDKSLDNGMELSDSLIRTILSTQNVEGVNIRIESFSLASNKNNTKGTLVMGIEPKKEDSLIDLSNKIIKGAYFNKHDKGILIGSKLAQYLELDVGDSLVLMGQGHWGNTAVGIFPVKGIVKMPAPNIDRQIVFMPLKTAQEYFSFPNGATSLVIKFKDADLTQKICNRLNSRLDTTQYKAMSWQKMSPEMLQQIQSDRISGIMMLNILYMIIAFGIFGTVLMMTEERKREFAMMIAIGMQKTKLAIITLYEALIMNSLGIIIGIGLSIPLVVYYHYYPIEMSGEMAKSIEKFGMEPVLPTMISFKIILKQALTVLIITIVAAAYPLWSILKLNVIKGLRR